MLAHRVLYTNDDLVENNDLRAFRSTAALGFKLGFSLLTSTTEITKTFRTLLEGIM